MDGNKTLVVKHTTPRRRVEYMVNLMVEVL